MTRDFTQLAKQLDRQSSFSRYLARRHPELHWLIQLLGDNAAAFLNQHQGKTIKLEMTIPTQVQLVEEARAIDCHLTLDQAKPSAWEKASTALCARYQCTAAELADFAGMGAALLKHADENSRKP